MVRLLGLISGLCGALTAALPSFPLPAVEFREIDTLDPRTGLQVANHLISLGGLQVTGIPNYPEARQAALENLADCFLYSPSSQATESQLKDGRRRLSVGVQSTGGAGLQAMAGECGNPSAPLRRITELVSLRIAALLDQTVVRTEEPVMSPFRSFGALTELGNHLEHLHAFYGSPNSSLASEEYALSLHTDSGLFIAMTAALCSPAEVSKSHDIGLHIELPSREIVRAVADPHSLIILVGQGGHDWLAPVLGAPMRALPHAVFVGSAVDTRSWYGKMFLPPAAARLPLRNGVNLSYGEYRSQEIRASQLKAVASGVPLSDRLPSACGQTGPNPTSHRFTQMVENSLCEEGNGILCWQQCYPLSAYSCGAEAECVDSETDTLIAGDVVCHSCQVQCPSPEEEEREDFCWGRGVDMFMDGFTSIALKKRGSVACLNLFFKQWALNGTSKFAWACVGILLLGVVIEALSVLRRKTFYDLTPSYSRNALLILLHSTQSCLGYFLMLAAMTYNVELFCMALTGIGVGHLLFNIQEPPQGTDACCPQISVVGETELTEQPPETKEYGTYRHLSSSPD